MDSNDHLFIIPPWDEPKASFIIKEIVGGKNNYNKDKTKKIYRAKISQLNKENDIIIYTDGSVDPTAGNSGSAAVFKIGMEKHYIVLRPEPETIVPLWKRNYLL